MLSIILKENFVCNVLNTSLFISLIVSWNKYKKNVSLNTFKSIKLLHTPDGRVGLPHPLRDYCIL